VPRGWRREFEDPIELPDGRVLVTLRDAATYITELPKKEAARARYDGRIGSRLYFRARPANKGSCWQGEGLDLYQPRTRIDDFTTPLEEAERLNNKSVVDALKRSTSA
jgi:hypothetical protein